SPDHNIGLNPDHNTIFNRGVAPERVSEITHRQIPQLNIQDNPRGRGGEHFDRNNHTLFVDRPHPTGNGNFTPPSRNSQTPRTPNWHHRPETSSAPGSSSVTVIGNNNPGNRVIPSAAAPNVARNAEPVVPQNGQSSGSLPARPVRTTPRGLSLNG